MSEPTKTRFTIDLDEIDRKLRRAAAPNPAQRREPEPLPDFGDVAASGAVPPPSAASPAARPTGGETGDPLRELARIVGQDDPFQSLLGDPANPVSVSRQTQQASANPARAGAASYAGALDFEMPALKRSQEVGDLADHLRPETVRGNVAPASYDPYASPYGNPQLPSAEDLGALENLAARNGVPTPSQFAPPVQEYAQYPETPADDPAYEPQFQTPLQPEQGSAPSGDAPRHYEQNFEEFPPSYANPSLGYQPGYHPEEDNSSFADAPHSRKWLLRGGIAIVAVGVAAGVYGVMRSKGIVGNSEPPVVVASSGPIKVAPAEPDGKEFPDQNKQIYQSDAKEGKAQIVNREEQPLDIRQATGATSVVNGDGLGEARKVKTIIVTVEGQPIGESPDAPAPAPQRPLPYVPALGVATPTAPVVTMPPPAASAEPTPDAAQTTQSVAPAPQPPAAPARPRATPPSATTPAATPSALPQRTATAAPTPGVTAAPPRASGGAYAVQFGTAGSEAEGKAKFVRMRSQYGAVLNSVAANVYSVSTANGTLYRIRSGGMSKDEADTLCNNLRTAASNQQICFVAKN